jgi:hypothetical protein
VQLDPRLVPHVLLVLIQTQGLLRVQHVHPERLLYLKLLRVRHCAQRDPIAQGALFALTVTLEPTRPLQVRHLALNVQLALLRFMAEVAACQCVLLGLVFQVHKHAIVVHQAITPQVLG